MRRIRVIPVLLIKNGGLVKTVKFDQPRYVGDPINAVRIFNEKEVDEIAVIDIACTRQKKAPDFDLVSQICGEAFMPLAYGGGISTLDQIVQILYQGAEKVILQTAAFDHPGLVSEAAARFGSQSIMVSIDAKKGLLGGYKVYRDNGTKATGYHPAEWAKRLEDMGVGEIIVNSISHDGTYKGYELPLVEMVAKAVSIPVVAQGGASVPADFLSAIRAGASAAAAGSMFVFQRPHQAVLVTYPTQEQLKNEVFSKI
jgi:imidazole glycerol-phosphate synthase subunit HisF